MAPPLHQRHTPMGRGAPGEALVGNQIANPTLPPRCVWDSEDNKRYRNRQILPAWMDEMDHAILKDAWMVGLRQMGGPDGEDMGLEEWQLTIGVVYHLADLEEAGSAFGSKEGDLESDWCWVRCA
ncbi:hypothetical protein EDD85DRAFT_962751 [Armillaria nabsnona]|nr:hypothetical protein EDD85DRAFT_962751 [Armillaria nabsnona]